MKREIAEQMLQGIEEKYIAEAASFNRKEAAKTPDGGRGTHSRMGWQKAAAIAASIVIVLGAGISVAASSDSIRGWLSKNFPGREVSKIDIIPEKNERKAMPEETDDPADIPVDQDAHLSLAENMAILGEKESFVYQYHYEGDDEIVDRVYSIQGNGLKKLTPKTFQGDYDGEAFSFEYVTIHQEIYGFNMKGVDEVFHFINDGKIYAALCLENEDTVTKACIAECDLDTGEMKKLTNDHTIGNMMMSPGGKIILINYRSKGYWTAFDLATQTEKRIDEINGYAHTNEIVFQDDYHVLTYGDTYMEGDTELTKTQVVDLRTGKRITEYRQCGDYDPEWVYSQKKGTLKISNVDGTTAIEINQVQGHPHPVASQGEYELLADLTEEEMPYYLCNLAEKSYMQIDALSGLGTELSISLAAKEKKMLLSDGKEAYLVDISELQQ